MKRKILLIIGVLILFLVVFYFVTFSPLLANLKPVISYRNAYVSSSTKTRSLLGLPYIDKYFKSSIVAVNTLKNDPNGYKYLYAIVGKLVAIDPENNTITLRDSNNIDYVITFVLVKDLEEGWYSVEGMTDINTRATTFYFYPSNLKRSVEKDSEYIHGEQEYTIYWKDARTQRQITKGFAKNKLNVIGNDNMSVLFISRY